MSAVTFRLITKDAALVNRVVNDVEHIIRHEQHEHVGGLHPISYKVVPPLSHAAAQGFTRTVYLHTRTDEATAQVRSGVADIAAMTAKEG